LLSSFKRHHCRKLKKKNTEIFITWHFVNITGQLVEGSVVTSVYLLWWATVKFWSCVLSLIT
jgi:hypothetical protein